MGVLALGVWFNRNCPTSSSFPTGRTSCKVRTAICFCDPSVSHASTVRRTSDNCTVLLFIQLILGSSLGGVGPERGLRGEEEGGGVRSGPGEARTILHLHIISVRASKQTLMVRTFLKVYMELGSYFWFLQEQIKDIIIRV